MLFRSIALSILCISSVMSRTLAALLSPLSAKVRIRMRLVVVKAVSAEEKKAERNNSRTKKASCAMSDVPINLKLPRLSVVTRRNAKSFFKKAVKIGKIIKSCLIGNVQDGNV